MRTLHDHYGKLLICLQNNRGGAAWLTHEINCVSRTPNKQNYFLIPVSEQYIYITYSQVMLLMCMSFLSQRLETSCCDSQKVTRTHQICWMKYKSNNACCISNNNQRCIFITLPPPPPPYYMNCVPSKSYCVYIYVFHILNTLLNIHGTYVCSNNVYGIH